MRQVAEPENKPKNMQNAGRPTGAPACATPERRGWRNPEIEKAARRTLARNREAIIELAKW